MREIEGFMINYDLPLQLVYTDFATACIQATFPASLDILAYCTLGLKSRDEFMISTWAPDWRDRACWTSFSKRLWTTSGAEPIPAYSAAKGLEELAPEGLKASVACCEMRLVVHGLCIDSVSGVPPVADITRIWKAISEWAQTVGADKYLPAGESRLSAFMRTLKADVTDEAPPDGVLWTKRISRRSGDPLLDENRESSFEIAKSTMESRQTATVAERRNVHINSGLMAMASAETQVNEKLYILCGGQMVYALRREGAEYALFGECYAHVVMDGEALPDMGVELERIKIH